MSAILRFLKHVTTNRTGQVLAAVHLLLVTYVFGRKPLVTVKEPCFIEPTAAFVVWAGREFLFQSETTLLKVIVILDAPALFVSNFIRVTIFPRGMCPYSQSWYYAGVSLFFTSIEWLLVGFVVSVILRKLKTTRPFSSRVHTQQFVGRERRERVSQLDLSGHA